MNKRSTKWYRKNEAEVMRRLGLKPTKNSGAGWIEKCDGENEHFLCELKSTDHESFSIKQSVLHVLEHHALEAHKIPLFAFQFINRDEVWVAIKEEDIQAYRELIERDVLSKLEEELDSTIENIKNGNVEQNQRKETASILSKCNEISIIMKKRLDKPIDKLYNKGEKERGGSEAVSFMPNTNTDKLFNFTDTNTTEDKLSNLNNNKNNKNNVNNNNLDVNMLDIDVSNTDMLNNSNLNSTNRNSVIKQELNVIDVNKVKHNINARNNYFKQKEQERRKQEQKFRTERRKTK